MSRCILLLNRASGANQRGLDATDVCQTLERIVRNAAPWIPANPRQIRGEFAARGTHFL